jgi:hypothetical protein
MSYIELNLSHFTGHSSTFHSRYIFWLHKHVHYVGVRRLQSAGEAQTGLAEYQTDTLHNRAEMRG